MTTYNYSRSGDSNPYSSFPPIPRTLPTCSVPPPVSYYPPVPPPGPAWERRTPGCPLDPDCQGWEPTLRRIGNNYEDYIRPYPDDYRGHLGTPPYGRDSGLGRESALGREGLYIRELGLGRESGFIPSSRRPTSPSTVARRQMLEIEEQLKICKEEIAKKDKLIEEMTHAEATSKTEESSKAGLERKIIEKESALVIARGEINAQQTRIENLLKEVNEMTTELESRDRRMTELSSELSSVKHSEARLSGLVESLQNKAADLESKPTPAEPSSDSSSDSSTAVTLQDSRELEQKIQELESKLRSSQSDLEHSETSRARVQQQLDDLIQQLGILGIDGATTSQYAIESVRIVMQENLQLKAVRETMRSQLEVVEQELKLSRDMIRSQSNALEIEKQSQAKHVLDLESVKLDKDKAVGRQRELEEELELLRERMDSDHRGSSEILRELEQARRRVIDLERDLENMEIRRRASEIDGGGNHRAEAQLQAFKEALALILSGDYTRVEPREEQIGERVEALIQAVKDKTQRISELEEQVSELDHELKHAHSKDKTQRISELEDQVSELGHELKRAHHKLATSVDGGGRRGILKKGGLETRGSLEDRGTASLERSLRYAEEELEVLSQLKEELKADRDMYMRFVEEMAARLKMDPQALDSSLEGATRALMARVEHLLGKEASHQQSHKTQIYNLQRKLKSVEEQLDSKDAHMELLRRKVASLEERLVGRGDMEREREEEHLKNRKLNKLVEKYKNELHEAEIEIRELKARLLHSTELQTRSIEKEKLVRELEDKVNELDHVRLQQANRLADLESDNNVKTEELNKRKDAASNTVHALTSELRTTKIAFDESTKREQQLLDLRQVIARMLGLQIDRLAVPDFEIVSRLEKLILANQANAATAYVLDTAISDMSDGFREGYQEAATALSCASRGLNTRSISPSVFAINQQATGKGPADQKPKTVGN